MLSSNRLSQNNLGLDSGDRNLLTLDEVIQKHILISNQIDTVDVPINCVSTVSSLSISQDKVGIKLVDLFIIEILC